MENLLSTENLLGLLYLFLYYLAFGLGVTLINRLTPITKEMARKSYHVMASLSIFVLLRYFQEWYAAIAAIMVLFFLAFVVVFVVEKLKAFRSLNISRPHRVRETSIPIQVLFLQAVLVLLIALFWGLMGPDMKYLAAVGVVAWGVGDSTAAVFGQKFGKIKYKNVIFDKKKTVEGTVAMISASFIGIFLILTIFFSLPLLFNLIVAIILAVASGLVEAMSRKGFDTLTIPLVVGALSIPLMLLMLFLEGIW